MITLTLPQALASVSFLIAGGVLVGQVRRNAKDIARVYEKIEDIWEYVRNGTKP